MKDKIDFFKRPWAITRDAFEILAGLDLDKCEEILASSEVKIEDFYERLDFDAGTGIATLEVNGSIMPSPSLMARYFMGAVDSIRIEQLIRDAHASPNVKALIVKVNTAGGSVTGTPEMGNAVADFASDKPIYIFSNGLVASAGYWLAAPATKLIGTESSRWGSVGVIRPHIDISEMRKKEGVKIEIFRNKEGAYKAAGAMNTSLTDEQREEIQDEIDKLGVKFRAHVSTHRPKIVGNNMRAQVFYADDALANGYIDAIVDNYEQAFSLIEAEHRDASPRSSASVDSLEVDTPSKALSEHITKENIMTQDQKDAEVKVKADAEAKIKADADAQAKIDEQAAEAKIKADADANTALISGLNDRIKASDEKVTSLTAELATIKADTEKIITEKAEAKAEELAQIKAAKIAAESGSTSINVTSAGDEGQDDYASLEGDALWAKYDEIRADKGDAAASAFYVKRIEGKA